MPQAPFAASRRISGLVQSDIRAMTRECMRVGGINLGQGLCELPTPEPVVQAAQAALTDDQKSVYSSPEGILPLRQAIARKLERENHIKANPETEIVVVNGSTGGFAATMMALLNPGDGILLFEPYYGYHLNAAILAELEPQYVPMNGDEKAIRAAIKPNTRAVVICTPNNPSGKMWSESDIRMIGKIATEKNLLVITDEMYEYFRYEGREHLSPMAYPELAERTVTLMGLSKTFSITGWRLGYVAAHEPLAQKIKLANDLFYVCAPTPLQHGVLAGFNIERSYFDSLQTEFKVKRDKICSALEMAGMPPLVPQGAYYVLADISKFGIANSKTFAMTMLEKIKVAAVPGRAFFNSEIGDKFIRLCFAVNDEALDQACSRLKQLKGGL
jgi:aminotransferase